MMCMDKYAPIISVNENYNPLPVAKIYWIKGERPNGASGNFIKFQSEGIKRG